MIMLANRAGWKWWSFRISSNRSITLSTLVLLLIGSAFRLRLYHKGLTCASPLFGFQLGATETLFSFLVV